MGWPTRDVALREIAIAERRRNVRREHDRLWRENLVTFLLAKSVPNRLAGVEINEDGDAI